jgi:Tfp pilus assembly protein PilO
MSRSAKPWQVHVAGATLVAGLGLGAYLLQIAPALSRHEQAAAHARDLSSEQDKQRNLQRTLVTLQEKVKQATKDASAAELKLEPASALNARLARLTELAAAHQLRVDSVQPGAATHQPRYSMIGIRLSGQGTYRNCAALLRRIQIEMPDVAVTSLDMGSSAVTVDAAATFAFDLLWYTRPIEPARKN